jgi:hypothetical protein
MGPVQHTAEGEASARSRRLGPRICLRKGCDRKFQPRRRGQLYCQDPECLREVRRWHAIRRQRKRRATAEGRRKHAQAEQERRRQRRAEGKTSPVKKSSPGGTQARAWSRRKRIPENFCDRPGCYDPRRCCSRVPARYCNDACRMAVRRVQDRQRKCQRRKTDAGRYKRQLEYERARQRRQRVSAVTPRGKFQSMSGNLGAVGHYGAADPEGVSWAGTKKGCRHDRETRADPRPRSPPAS